MSVTFINPGKEGERFWDMVTETMQAAARDFSIELEVLYAQRNRVHMAELGVAVANRSSPPDYLLLVNEEQAAERILAATRSTSVKTLMLLNDLLPEQYQRLQQSGAEPLQLLGSVVPDNFAAGQRMMRALLDCARAHNPAATPYHMLAIGGDQRTPASIDRNNGALSVIEAEADIVLDRFLYANWNAEEAAELTLSYLDWANRNAITPTAIWAANDPIAAGASESLQRADLQPGKDVCLVGLNWSADGLDRVRNQEMLLTDGGHFLAGAWALVLLHDYHQRLQAGDERIIGRVNFQMQSIDQHNIATYLQHLGEENWDKIDFRGFSLLSGTGKTDTYDFSLARVFALINSGNPGPSGDPARE